MSSLAIPAKDRRNSGFLLSVEDVMGVILMLCWLAFQQVLGRSFHRKGRYEGQGLIQG